MNRLDFLIALPEIVLLAGACALMIVDLFVKSEGRRVSFAMAQCVLLACALATAFVLLATTTVTEDGELRVAVVYGFHGLFIADLMAHVLKLAAYGAVSLALVYSRRYLIDRGLLRGEFLTLLLFALLGMMVMMSANSFLTVYLGLELLSLCLYALVALNRDSAASTEAAMKYFVLGALASGMLLYGMSMIYGATGTLTITEVAKQIGLASKDITNAQQTFLVFGLAFMVSGIAFKLGVVPFHMWIPDVYHGATTAVTLVIGTAPKLAAFAMAMRLLVNGLLDVAHEWQQMLVILAVLSMAIGNVTAIAQTNLKRMLAYSTIAHMGFMLLGLLSGVVGGNWLNAADAYAAAMFYMLVYVLMSLGSFGMLLFLSHKGFECENLDDLKGLNQRNPWYAFIILLLMFSLAGVPPTVGFYAKLVVLSAAVDAGQVWLAVVAVAFSIVGAFYYLRVVKLMYFDEPVDAAPVSGQGLAMRILISANGIALLVLGLLPGGLLKVCFLAIKNL
ncbi:MAG TPA: NADH-quinone oxidoreductase subunit NuoN [Burkholderiales bacterium]|nr:NADH-quinone oxidoreductase subunit NuoN [Burkholderiales bacterium]